MFCRSVVASSASMQISMDIAQPLALHPQPGHRRTGNRIDDPSSLYNSIARPTLAGPFDTYAIREIYSFITS